MTEKDKILQSLLEDDTVKKFMENANENDILKFYNNIEKIYEMLHIKKEIDNDILSNLSDTIIFEKTNEVDIIDELDNFNKFYKKNNGIENFGKIKKK